MINDNTILSSFDDKPTLLEWLKKVEDALKTDTATAVSVENPSANTYVFKITFADGETLSSGNVVFPDSVKDVSIKNGHIIVTSVGGNVEDLGVLNPYADTIVVNAETNTTEIGNNVGVNGDLSVQGSVVGRGIVTSMGRLTANNGIEVHGQGYVNGTLGVTGNATIGGRLQADSSIISNGEIRGGNISGTKFLLGTEEMPLVKANPTGEATETLEKIKIGNVAYNVGGGGGGSDYTAGSNIEISESKEIAVKSALTGINSLKFAPAYGCSLSSDNYGDLHVKTTSPYHSFSFITLHKSDNSKARINLWCNSDYSGEQNIRLSAEGFNGGDAAVMITRGYVPPVPKEAGTYILKATVQSGGFATYTWELQQ